MSHKLRLFTLFALLAACSDNQVGVYNTPPSVSITAPEDGASVQPGVPVEFYGVARDQEQDMTTLDVMWSSSIDGDLGASVPDVDGFVYLPVVALSGGTHAITLSAIDRGGQAAQTSISLDVGFGGSALGAPTVILLGPTDGEMFTGAETVTVVGTATDDEQSWDTLHASIRSSRDGELWSGNPTSSGAMTVDLPELSVGEHLLELLVQDDDGNIGQASVSISILEDGRPQANIISPSNGSMVWTTDTVLLEGSVSDDVSDPDTLGVTWSSDVDGTLSSGYPDSSGYTAVGVHLTEATHVIHLDVSDEDGNTGSDSLTLRVIDPRNDDGDGDGQTENQGDCNDSDATVYTGATEACDAVDNDCDGLVNETYMDIYEPNDTEMTAYDLGEIDTEDLFSTGASSTLSELTAHSSTDQDWFFFDVDDEIYDNADITVTATRLPANTTWVLELWDCNNGGQGHCQFHTSDSGSGSLSVHFAGDSFDTDEDLWAIRAYTTTWSSSGCSTRFQMTVSTN